MMRARVDQHAVHVEDDRARRAGVRLTIPAALPEAVKGSEGPERLQRRGAILRLRPRAASDDATARPSTSWPSRVRVSPVGELGRTAPA